MGDKKCRYIDKVVLDACGKYLEKDGYLFVSQGSLLEGYLYQNYKLVSLYEHLLYTYTIHGNSQETAKILSKGSLPEKKHKFILRLLKEQKSIKNLFKSLFDKDIPEEECKLALKLLAGCLPANHIYEQKKQHILTFSTN